MRKRNGVQRFSSSNAERADPRGSERSTCRDQAFADRLEGQRLGNLCRLLDRLGLVLLALARIQGLPYKKGVSVPIPSPKLRWHEQGFCRTVGYLANTRNGGTTKAYAGHYSTLALPAS